MSLKTVVLTISVSIMVLAVAFVLGSVFLMHGYVDALIPDDVHASIEEGLMAGFAVQAASLVILAVVLPLLSNWADTTFIYGPLRKISGVMEAYAIRGERHALPKLEMAPKEIQTLGTVFEEFTARVEASHARDLEVSRVKSDFISTAAHQLRTPLTGIRWALEALERENLTEEQKALVKSAVDKSHDLVSVVSTLLDISSIESGKYQYKLAPTSLQDLVAEVTNDFRHLAEERQVGLSYEIGEGRLPMVRADRERIKWVLNNLIENAIRYTPGGGHVRVSIATAPGRIQVLVHDTGIGINPQDRGNIFERFYRAGNAISKENAGNGLGLYIARTIATDHRGDLNFVPNTDGPGTTFVLSLPLAG